MSGARPIDLRERTILLVRAEVGPGTIPLEPIVSVHRLRTAPICCRNKLPKDTHSEIRGCGRDSDCVFMSVFWLCVPGPDFDSIARYSDSRGGSSPA